MYPSNCQTSVSMTLDCLQNKAGMQQFQTYHVIVAKKAADLMREFEALKKSLEKATQAYLNKIEHKFFRNAGRQRALAFKEKLAKVDDMPELIAAFEEAVKEGNENYDSLKTFLIKAIHRDFNLQEIINSHPSRFRPYSHELPYGDILNDIIRTISKELKPREMPEISVLKKF